ncbi:MAG: nitrilase family protein [Muribaculaceae bacterium]|nr:nitrilase family protein [Muribaculaceae bacterium]
MPDTNLKVALIPMDMRLGDAQYNVAYATRMIEALDADTDLVVLPEMCTTGYSLDPMLVEKFVEAPDGQSVTALRKLSERRGMAIWGTFACVEDGKYYNRGFMIDPDASDIKFYDKRHLFSVGREDMLYTPGEDKPSAVSFRGWKLQMCICYDLRFPVWCRNVNCGYDALILPANWPEARQFAWYHLLVARAIENQAYVCGCNRLGEDPYGSYSHELSYVFNHWGDDISDRSTPGVVYAVLDGKKLTSDRLRFGPWRDADDFTVFVD